MQQEVGFDIQMYCDWNDDLRLCGVQSSELLQIAVTAFVILLFFSPTILGFLFERLGWRREEAWPFAVPTRFENGYLALLGALMFASLLWALVPPAEGLFSNPVDRALAELTQLGQSATQALACAAVVGGPLFLVGFLQYALERRLGKGNSSLLLGAATVSVALGLGVMDSIRADVLLFGGMIGASLIVAYRSVPRLAVWAGGVAGGFFLVAAAIQVVTVVAAGAYESAAAVGGLLARSW